MIISQQLFNELKENILKQKKTLQEIISLQKNMEKSAPEEQNLIASQIRELKESLNKTNQNLKPLFEEISFIKPLPKIKHHKEKKPADLPEVKTSQITTGIKPEIKFSKTLKIDLSELEKKTLKRLKKKEEKVSVKKIKKPSKYVNAANRLFFNFSNSLAKKEFFRTLGRDLSKADLKFTPKSYISTILFTSVLAFFAGVIIFSFFLFFNLGALWPFITKITEPLLSRFLKIFWILFAAPVGTFFLMYFYPSMEKASIGNKLNQELPFATIHMSAISGSMVDPSKIFSIINATKEYPGLEKQFTKLINEINIYGYDLVSALRNTAFNSPSKRLSELFNGLATTITSGGNLRDFFEKRAQTLLFDYRLEREKYTKFAETFMDIYISVVIAAPMILMLLIIMIKISGLGIPLSTSMISLLMVLGVSVLNIVFLAFLHLKQPTE